MAELHIISGDDDFARKERARQRVSALLGGDIDGNPALEIVAGDGDASPDEAAAEFLSVLRTPPFLEPHRVVWLRHFDELDRFGDAKPGSAYAEVADMLCAKERPDDTDIVLDGRTLDQRKSFAKKLKAAGAVIESCSVGRPGDRNQAAFRKRGVEDFFAAAGKSIDANACQYLLETIGGDSGTFKMELDKLLAYVGDADRVTLADCRAVTSRTPEALGWEFSSAVADGKLALSLQILGQLFDSGVFELQILGILASDCQKMVQTRLAMRELKITRVNPRTFDNLPEEVRAAAPGNPLLKLHPYRAFKLCEGAARLPEAELARRLRLIRNAGRALVSSGMDKRIVLEQLVGKLVAGGE
jgi:DNA polymerase III delta subunit